MVVSMLTCSVSFVSICHFKFCLKLGGLVLKVLLS
jgi:hypothetical protein